ncbi:DNA-binding transcriptional regulator, AcrR family [Halovenus aranensis]|jgi:AcrR family transcriptional regulator|uniref:DNA-binding transcriptional regulator, AcrR family n=1 Tax=Halovenus aranensis TaxID=890420 RepID=A0A1G8TW22_9EURY|nr:TetR/AcrR family transcriptional regulator [Halovenus aranensis]SDJ45095.1 DNA-binding transcriptional regulator, AcrR family [Halovenus aranensis]
MNDSVSFFEEPEDTREEILKATYEAFCEHGYSDITIQKISDKFPKSKSLLYHHYDGKDELLLDFLEFMLSQAEEQFPLRTGEGADEHIELVLDTMFLSGGILTDEDFSRAMVELRAEAAHDERYREYFTRTDRFTSRHVEYLIRSGIEQGVFQEVDPEETAAMFQVMFVGTATQKVTSNESVLEACRSEFERYIRNCLLRDDTDAD